MKNFLLVLCITILAIIVFFVSLSLGGIVCAQSKRTEREKAWRMERLRKRAEARAMEQHQDSIAYQAALLALKEGSWVLETNNVNFANGVNTFAFQNELSDFFAFVP